MKLYQTIKHLQNQDIIKSEQTLYHSMKCGKVFTNDTSHKGLIFKIHKQSKY